MSRNISRGLVEFLLGSEDISTIRFGISPGFELVNAVRVISRPAVAPLHWGWVKTLDLSVPDSALGLLRLICGERGYVPDFLTTTPTGDMTPREELDRLAEVSDQRIYDDLSKMATVSDDSQGRLLLRLAANPEEARGKIVSAWERLWDRVLDPVWPQLHHLLQADITVQARRTSFTGLESMVKSLHSTVTWNTATIHVGTAGYSEVVDCGGTGVVLVPSVFSPTDFCSLLTAEELHPTIFYPAHGIAETWHTVNTKTIQSLQALLGSARAQILLNLQQPLSTSECAHLTHLAVSTAHHHLTVLRGAGLIDSRREGTRVLHTRSPLGEALTTTL